MVMNDPIGDLLARIRNAQMRKRNAVMSPASKLRSWVLDVLESEGFIRGYRAVQDLEGKRNLEIDLKYFDGQPVIKELKRISTPGRRVYTGVKNIPRVRQGLGIAIISTPKGVMSDNKARATNVGGEVLCTVF
ncbi:MAG: 30S ribosomal protein S8 [Pseudomonadota bacterium]|jgi:small subunit ribosomal protein S8|nr:30S ribosomal protein S8 [Pseudomonadota bacterium]|tara:strand:+ start:378 stop:776 length:399 start_codon:yes stop_codon:yes gene_type:complete